MTFHLPLSYLVNLLEMSVVPMQVQEAGSTDRTMFLIIVFLASLIPFPAYSTSETYERANCPLWLVFATIK